MLVCTHYNLLAGCICADWLLVVTLEPVESEDDDPVSEGSFAVSVSGPEGCSSTDKKVSASSISVSGLDLGSVSRVIVTGVETAWKVPFCLNLLVLHSAIFLLATVKELRSSELALRFCCLFWTVVNPSEGVPLIGELSAATICLGVAGWKTISGAIPELAKLSRATGGGGLVNLI